MDPPDRKAAESPVGLVRRVLTRARALAAANAELKREIAQRKRAQEETEKQKEILQRIFDNAPVMLNFIGADGQLQLVNREWERTLGWTQEEVCGRDVIAEFYPDPFDYQEVQDFLARGEAEWREFKTRVRDGRIIATSWAAIHLADGTRVGVGKDITARKIAEEKLRLSESLLAESQSLAHVGSWNRDVKTKLVTWSDESYNIFGVDRDSFQPTHETFLECLHPEDRNAVVDLLESLAKTGEQSSYHTRIVRPDGEVRTLYVQARVERDPQGSPVRLFGMVQDITEQQAIEDALKASNEILRSLSVRLQSVREEEGARIARELHDELGSVLTTLRWDLDSCASMLSAEEPTQPEVLRGRIDGIARLAHAAIQSVRRIASELRPSVLDDLGLMEAIEWQARQFQVRSGIDCTFDNHAAGVNFTQEQSTALFRILQESLTNILRHAEATRVLIATGTEEGGFVLKIQDNGRGISEEQSSSAGSLGLLGMRERAEEIGGTIEIAPAGGGGTTVIVRLINRRTRGAGSQ
jgi:PAS domain S-box-containing protein